MNTLMLSPYSIPLAGIGLAALAVVVSAFVKINKAKYQSMAPDLQKVLDDNSGMNIAEWLGDIWDAAETPGEKKCADSGEIIVMEQAEVDKLRTMVEKPVTDRWIAEVGKKGIDGNALVAEAHRLIAKYTK